MTPTELRDIRQRLNLSQQAFGERLGFSLRRAAITVSEMENGRKLISHRTALMVRMLEEK